MGCPTNLNSNVFARGFGKDAGPASSANVSIIEDVAEVKAAIADLATDLGTLTTKVDVIDGNVDDVETKVDTVDTVVNTINTNNPALTLPSAPHTLVVTPGDAQASVAFQAPTVTGDYAITAYNVKTYAAGVEVEEVSVNGSGSPVVVTGLTNGTAYTFKVAAVTAMGNGAQSAASDAATPFTG